MTYASPQPRLLLASGSPRRIQLLQELGIKFQIKPSLIPETIKPNEDLTHFAKRLALEKALYQSKRIQHSSLTPLYVLGADTIVILKGQLMGKPSDPFEAKRFLTALSGQTHEVVTAFAIIESPDTIILWDSQLSHVTMRKISPLEMDEYIKTGEPFDKAGGYAVQGIGKKFIKKVEGSLTNVIGLPVEALVPWFKKLGL